MTLLSFFILAIYTINPIGTQDLANQDDNTQTLAAQLNSVSKGLVSPNPAHGARLRLRQQMQCADPGYSLCQTGDTCCPSGDNCCPLDCCPSGTTCCNRGGCLYPGGECCSGGWACPPGQTCVEGVQPLCNRFKPKTTDCPTTTLASTLTIESTFSGTTTTTITKVPEEEEWPEFSCPPMTAINDLGDTLVLGDDCSLEYTQGSAAATAATSIAAQAQPRAAACPEQLVTSTTTTTTTTTTYVETKTTTVTVAETALPDFSCPPMTVTNALGDELTMDEECAMEFSPGSGTQPPPTETGAASRINGGSHFLVLFAAISAMAITY